MHLRRFVALAIAVACVVGASGAAAQPVMDRLLVVAPAAPGGGWDQTARALQHVLEAEGIVRLVEVQNLPGAAGTIGLSQFVNAERGNGRALLVSGLVMLGATLWNDAPVSIGQATPIARLTGEYEVLAVPASSPYRDLKSLIEAFRLRPEAFAWGGGSAGGTDHILAGLLAEAAGVDPRRVNYVAFSGGGEAVAALLGGHVAAGISGYSEFAAHIASGRLRAIGISSAARAPGLDVPTIREGGLDIELVNWRAVLAPAGISAADKIRLTGVVARAVRGTRWKTLLTERQWTDLYLDGAAFDEYLRAERGRLARVVTRLRGPATGAPVAAGRRIVPVAVLAGSLLVLLAQLARYARSRRRMADPANEDSDHFAESANQRAISVADPAIGDCPHCVVCLGLVAFLLLLRPLGFVVAATVLFALTSHAFGSGVTASNSGHTRNRAISALRAAAIGLAFCTLVYLAFTRGLGLALPAGSVWAWMH